MSTIVYGVWNPKSTKRLMPHNDRFPLFSRDWEDIDCKAGACLNNKFGKCGVPSLAKIDSIGHCKGFTSKYTDNKEDNRG